MNYGFLIYPYWNVNYIYLNKEDYYKKVSNLSILECKHGDNGSPQGNQSGF